MADADEKGRLERTLGFTEAFTIGVGTMIGAGIFIFPGLAAGRAGLAATVSFGIGAVIALLVALSVSEDFDLVVAAERAPTVGDHLFGSPVEGLLAEVDGPVLVVRLGE